MGGKKEEMAHNVEITLTNQRAVTTIETVERRMDTSILQTNRWTDRHMCDFMKAVNQTGADLGSVSALGAVCLWCESKKQKNLKAGMRFKLLVVECQGRHFSRCLYKQPINMYISAR